MTRLVWMYGIDDSRSDYSRSWQHLGRLWRSGRWIVNFPHLPTLLSRRRVARDRWTAFEFSWSVLPARQLAVGLTFDLWGGESNDAAKLHLGLPGVWLWWALKDWMPQRWRWGSQREIGLFLRADEYSMSLHWSGWCDPFSWSSHEPWWRNKSWSLTDLALGRLDARVVPLSSHRFDIPLPEGVYPATIDLRVIEHHRPRWFTSRVHSADITPDTPVPVPGKGENSWDVGDDATWSMCTPAYTIEEAVASFVRDILRTRIKHGWRDGHPPARVPA